MSISLIKLDKTILKWVFDISGTFGFNQTIEVADQRGLARAGQAHNNGDLTRLHVDVDVLQTQNMAVLAQKIGL